MAFELRGTACGSFVSWHDDCGLDCFRIKQGWFARFEGRTIICTLCTVTCELKSAAVPRQCQGGSSIVDIMSSRQAACMPSQNQVHYSRLRSALPSTLRPLVCACALKITSRSASSSGRICRRPDDAIEPVPGAATHAARVTDKAGLHHHAPAPKPNVADGSKLRGAAACRTTSCCSRPTSPALARWVCLTCISVAAPGGSRQCCRVCSPSPLMEGPRRSQCVGAAHWRRSLAVQRRC
jgi:hypothetical protein